MNSFVRFVFVMMAVAAIFSGIMMPEKTNGGPQPPLGNPVHVIFVEGGSSFDPMWDFYLQTVVFDPQKGQRFIGTFHHGLEAGSMSSLTRYDGRVWGITNLDGVTTLVLVRETTDYGAMEAPTVDVLRGEIEEDVNGELALINVTYLDRKADFVEASLKLAIDSKLK